MNSSIPMNYLKKFFHTLPEVWYIMLFTILAHSNIRFLLNRGDWNSGNMFMIIFCAAMITLLVIQLMKKNIWSQWSRVVFGMLFTLCSLYMSFALLSEYLEFPNGTESGAIQLLAGGSLLTGTSLLLAVKMLLKGLLD